MPTLPYICDFSLDFTRKEKIKNSTYVTKTQNSKACGKIFVN
jgi:hypothetical protein